MDITEHNKIKVFVSYTIRDGIVNKTILEKIYSEISKTSNSFIDLLHNKSVDKQKRVLDELTQSNVILLIITESTYDSKWVLKEIDLAEELNIPIIYLEYEKLKSNLSLINNELQLFMKNYTFRER